MNFKNTLKLSLIYILLTCFLEKLYYLIFNIQKIQEISFAQILFNPFVFSVIFIIILILLINSITKKEEYVFKEILISVLLFIVFISFFQYLNDLIFYHLNNLIYAPIQSESKGLLSLLETMSKTFEIPTLSIFNELLINPFFSLLHSIKTFNLKMFYIIILTSKVFLTTIVIFYYSLYILFKKLDKKGINAIIPIKNNLTLLNITNKPVWWIFPLLIPMIRFIPKYYINVELVKKLKKGLIFSIGMTIIPWFFYGLLSLNKNTIINNEKNII